MHEVLVNRLGGLSLPRKSVVRLTDRPDMTLDVYSGRKTKIQQQHIFSSFGIIGLILSQFENRVPLKRGRGQSCTITLLRMNRLNKTESAIFFSLMCYLLPEDLHSELTLRKCSSKGNILTLANHDCSRRHIQILFHCFFRENKTIYFK